MKLDPRLIQVMKIRQEEIESSVLNIVYEKDGRKFIDLENYALDFKQSYLFKGFTKSGNVKLGEITQYGINGKPDQVRNRLGKVEDGKLQTNGFRFSVRLNQ